MKLRHSCPLCLSTATFLLQVQQDEYYECPKCEGIFLAEKNRLNEIEELGRYQLHQNKVEDIRYQNFVKPLVEAVKKKFPVTAGGLDFGCGSGPVIAKMLSDAGYVMKKYDPFFFDIKENLQRSYDFIVCCEVMEHFYHPKKEFALLYKLLLPGGKLYAKTSLVSFEIRADFKNWYYKDDPTHVFLYAEKTLRLIKQQYNFSDLQIEEEYFVFKK